MTTLGRRFLIWITASLTMLVSACGGGDAVPSTDREVLGDSASALSCPPRSALCVDVAADRAATLSVSATSRGELAQTLRSTAAGYPSALTLMLKVTALADPTASLVADLRLTYPDAVSGVAVPTDATATQTVARGRWPLKELVLGSMSAVTLPLAPVGQPRPLVASTGTTGPVYALVWRIESAGAVTVELGTAAVTDAALDGSAFDRARLPAGSLWTDPVFAPVAGRRVVGWALVLEAKAAPSCSDGLLGPGETDVDCGGTCSARCARAKKCVVAADCSTGVCTAGLCGPSVCTNGKFDAVETDVDCGGTCDADCAVGKRCKLDTDCVSTLRCVGASGPVFGACLAPVCGNGVKDPGELDVDCGGVCGRCSAGQTCTAATQCASGRCDLTAKKCLAASCVDRTLNGGETDIDCGRVCSKLCGATQKCLLNGDCASGACVAGRCAASPCLDKKKSPGETDVDCGGVCTTGQRLGAPTPLRCTAGKRCAVDGDCATGLVCPQSGGNAGRCVAPLCANGTLDTGESEADCGGSCPACADGAGCRTALDCVNKSCVKAKPTDTRGVCRSTCSDKVASGGESDVDCGQVCASGSGIAGLCVVGKKCAGDLDCASGLCAPATRLCVDTCRNNQVDVTEGDVDCGGPCSARCLDGQRCSVSADCLSGACSGGQCVPATCSDGLRNGSETAIDCGGACPADCASGGACATSADCAGGLACKVGVCVTSTCADLVQGGTESDVDCGGACTTKKCVLGKMCRVTSDCAPGTACVSGVCRASTCADRVKNGTESAVDCGGSCVACNLGVSCVRDSDCASRNCDLLGSKKCVAPSTANTKIDGTETDLNCGGGSAPRCADLKKCKAATDCVSSSCVADRCTKATCVDGIQNGAETAIDCGGSCGPCPAGRPCFSDQTCASNLCLDGRCAGYACNDGLRNGAETDIDCGGSCGRADPDRRCRVGQRCLATADCDPGAECRDYVCTCPPGRNCARTDSSAACAGVRCLTPPGPCYEAQGTCRGGSCFYRPVALRTGCSDSDECTLGDLCDGDGQCVGVQVPGCVSGCNIDGEKVVAGATRPGSPCEVCDPVRSNKGWSSAPAGQACDDGEACSVADSCTSDGTCAGLTAADGNLCGDGAVCESGACAPGCWIDGRRWTPGAAHPTDPCLVCDPMADPGAWSPRAPGAVCDDADVCTTGDQCAADGSCAGVQSSSTCQSGCTIGGVAYAPRAANPANPCQRCDPRVSTSDWSMTADGALCGDSIPGAWGSCSFFDGCATVGERMRDVTAFVCQTGACVARPDVEAEGCMRDTEGAACGASTGTDWSACVPDSTGVLGAQSRVLTVPQCISGVCQEASVTETRVCIPSGSSSSCGAPVFGAWSVCKSEQGTCATQGVQSRSVTVRVPVDGGGCADQTIPEEQRCTRVTDALPCGDPAVTGPWSECVFGDEYSRSGMQKRTVWASRCTSGACQKAESIETQTCTRDLSGKACAAPVEGAWSVCGGFSDLCDSSGQQTRTVTRSLWTNGSCVTATSQETQACDRDTKGDTCDASVGGAWGACTEATSPAGAIAAEQSRQVTDSLCSDSICSPSIRTETRACLSAMAKMCGSIVTGPWSECRFDGVCSGRGKRTRTVVNRVYAGTACVDAPVEETETCTRPTDGTVCDVQTSICRSSSSGTCCAQEADTSTCLRTGVLDCRESRVTRTQFLSLPPQTRAIMGGATCTRVDLNQYDAACVQTVTPARKEECRLYNYRCNCGQPLCVQYAIRNVCRACALETVSTCQQQTRCQAGQCGEVSVPDGWQPVPDRVPLTMVNLGSPTTILSAVDQCSAGNGVPAVPVDAADQQWLLQFMASKGMPAVGIGVTSRGHPGIYSGAGRKLTPGFAPWMYGAPDPKPWASPSVVASLTAHNATRNAPECVQLTSAGVWQTVTCGTVLPVLCEKRPLAPAVPKRSCKDLFDGGARTSGAYTIDPDGAGPTAPFPVYCDMDADGGGWTLLDVDTFEANAEGWLFKRLATDSLIVADNKRTSCDVSTVLGGYGQVSMGFFLKNFDSKGVAHSEVRLAADLLAIDSWNGEDVVARVDGMEVKRVNPCNSNLAQRTCNNTNAGTHSFCGGFDVIPFRSDRYLPVSAISPSSSAVIPVQFQSALDEIDPTNEAFAIDNVYVWVR